MLENTKHVVWDWNGTLLDDVEAALASINAMLEQRGMPVLSKDRYREIFGFPVIDCYRVLGFEFSTHREWDEIAIEFHSHYNSNVEGSGLTRGARELLAHLSGRGIGMSVLSASEAGKLEEMLAHYGIDGCFQNVKGHSNLYGSSKIEIGRELMEGIEVPAEQVLLVGDTVHDYEVARDVGCECVLYLNGHQDAGRLAGCGCPTVADLACIMA